MRKYLVPLVIAFIAFAMFQSAEAAPPAAPKTTATPQVTPPRVSCAEMLRLWDGRGGPPCVQISACGYVGFRSDDDSSCKTPTPAVSSTPSPTAMATPARLSCEEMLRIYNAESFHVSGPPCIQVRTCGTIGYSDDAPCPKPTPVQTPTVTPTTTPVPSPTATPPPPQGTPVATPQARSSGTGGCLFGPPFCNNITPPPTPKAPSPCEAIIGLYNKTGKNAAQALVVCNGGTLPPVTFIAPPDRNLPPTLRLPNAGS